MFDHDWFHNGGLEKLVADARHRCAARHFADARRPAGRDSAEYERYFELLDTRVILYLKDGLTYELKEISQAGLCGALAFECVPVDENYKTGAIVLIVPFEDIARVEVFAVHPDDKPTENLKIPGFRSGAAEGVRE